MKKRKIAITGIGMVTPLGHDTNSTWEALIAGRSGIDTISQFDASGFAARIAAEVKHFDIHTQFKNKKLLKYTVPFTQYALASAQQAFDDAGIAPTQSSSHRWGCVVGSGMMTAEYDYWLRFKKHCALDGKADLHKLHADSESFFSITDFAKTQINSGLGLLTQAFGIRGYSNAVHTACASGGQAMGLALQAIRRGDSDYMLVGGYDSMINPFGLASFCLLGALSQYNDSPATASRPFDLTRNGFVLGEGAAFLILEDFEKAKARGAKVYALLAGEGNSISAYRITDSHPSGDGAIQAIQGALSDAGIRVQEIDYINAHGTATKMNDLCETNAMKHVFGEQAYQLSISSTKGQTGHLIAAAGALEAAITALSIYHQTIPQTANFVAQDPDCDLDYCVDGAREKSIGAAMSNSFGFGGSNSCLVFTHSQWQGDAYV